MPHLSAVGISGLQAGEDVNQRKRFYVNRKTHESISLNIMLGAF